MLTKLRIFLLSLVVLLSIGSYFYIQLNASQLSTPKVVSFVEAEDDSSLLPDVKVIQQVINVVKQVAPAN